jgi:serine/threonine-protein kinase
MSDEERLDQLLLDWENEFDRGRDVPAAELCRGCPHLGGRLAEQIAKLRSWKTPPADDEPPEAPELPREAFAGLRYQPRKWLASGGLGAVFEAYDEEVGRTVALKRIKGEAQAGQPDKCERFRREAEITGRLEHPGVVPIYGLGADASGRPYYAMRLIKGESLKDAAAAFHAADRPGRDPGGRAVAFRQLLQRFVAVCQAVAYAHSRGVVHRDLKPANVMLGPYGETLVVDWGLAKTVGRRGPYRAAGEETLEPPSADTAEATRTGRAMGTPAFMGPEQAAGRWDEVGPGSDVFSLGATLYAVLTGRAPYQGVRALADAQEGRFPPPREVKPQVPAALEAVCLKAMAVRPEGRYATALDLAGDVERWLADEPVSAYPEPWTARAMRWVKRRRTAVAAALAAVLAAVPVLAVSVALLTAANASERRAKEVAEQRGREVAQQRDRAEKNLQTARELVGYFGKVARSFQMEQPGMEPVRRLLRERQRQFYDQLAAGPGDRDSSQRAAVLRDEGGLTFELGDRRRGLELLGQSLALYEDLARAQPDQPGHRRGVADCLMSLAVAYKEQGELDRALGLYHRAADGYERLAGEHPNDPEYLFDLAITSSNEGNCLDRLGERERARAAYERSADLSARIAARFPAAAADPEYRDIHGLALYHRGLTGKGPADPEAERALRESARVYGELVREFPFAARYRHRLGLALIDHANVLLRSGRPPREAEGEYGRAFALARRLVRDYPETREYREVYANASNRLGMLMEADGRLAEAEAVYTKGLTLYEDLMEDYPQERNYPLLAAGYSVNLAYAYRKAGDLPHAEQALRKAQSLLTPLARRRPDDPELPGHLANIELNLGELALQAGRLADAKTHLEASLPKWTELARKQPGEQFLALGLGECRLHLGHLAQRTGRPEEAADQYGRAVVTLTSALKGHFDLEGFGFLGDAHDGRVKTLCALGRFDDALADVRQALAGGDDPNRTAYLLLRARVLACSGDHARAMAQALEAVARPPRAPRELLDAAAVAALSAAAARRDAKPPAAEREATAGLYTARAVEWLTEAVAAGGPGRPAVLERLRSDPDLAALRDRDDVKALLAKPPAPPK